MPVVGKYKKINYSIRENVNIGEVRVSDEVVVIIAALAATEVEGVKALSGNITNHMASKIGASKLSKGVKLHVSEGRVVVDLKIYVKEGYNIPDVSSEVQDNVKNSIETMTALRVARVNVMIAKIAVEKA